jgi:AcrR family transcriptional regulator
MPKNTFLNLPDEKRTLIEDVAMQEFAEFGFANASINRIVANAGIAKGSFYQYFANKGDLFQHILARISQEKLAYVTPVLQSPTQHDFFTLLQELFRVGLAYAKNNPIAGYVGFEIIKNQNIDELQELFQSYRTSGIEFYKSLLLQGIARGELDPDIDLDFVGHMLLELQLASFNYYFNVINHGSLDPEDWGDDFMPIINKMIQFIKNGVQAQTETLNSTGVLSQ